MQTSTSSIHNWNKVATNCSICRERSMSTQAVSYSTRSGTRRCNITTNYSICPGSSMQASTSSIYNWNKVATNCSFCRERGMSTLAVSSSTRSGTSRCNIITTSYCRDNYSTCWESIKTSITLGIKA